MDRSANAFAVTYLPCTECGCVFQPVEATGDEPMGALTVGFYAHAPGCSVPDLKYLHESKVLVLEPGETLNARVLPPLYCGAELRNVTTPFPPDGAVGLGFDMDDGSVLRVKLSGKGAETLSRILADVLRQE